LFVFLLLFVSALIRNRIVRKEYESELLRQDTDR